MARYDKYDPISGGIRATIAANYPDALLGVPMGVGFNSSGQLVVGSGQTGIIGVLVVTQKPGRVGPQREIGVVDVMKRGCITDFGPSSATPGVAFGTAGTAYYSDVLGNISATPGVGSVYVGHTVEPDRLEVAVLPVPLVAGQEEVATVSAWSATHAYAAGTYATVTGGVLEVTTAGTSGASAPTAPATVGGTVTDGSVTWTRVQ